MKKLLFLLVASTLFLRAGSVAAFEIQDLSGTSEKGDFVLGPGKIELFMEPGQKATRNLSITNRLGRDMNFKIEIEDFTGSQDPNRTVVLLGDQRGPYSLKDYLKPEVDSFIIGHGQRIILPVEIFIPEDAEPGGLYGSVIISTTPLPFGEEDKEEAAGQVRLVSRVGTLFFIRVKGEVEEEGFLKSFSTRGDKRYFEKGPIPFSILLENKGNIHLTPYGVIEITNLLGKKVGEIEVDPYFAMPGSVRAREVEWNGGFLFGRYNAVLALNRGYEDIIDQKEFYFWIIPWKIITIIGVSLILLIFFFVWIASHFEIRRKTKEA